jgi:hypothetical protein
MKLATVRNAALLIQIALFSLVASLAQGQFTLRSVPNKTTFTPGETLTLQIQLISNASAGQNFSSVRGYLVYASTTDGSVPPSPFSSVQFTPDPNNGGFQTIVPAFTNADFLASSGNNRYRGLSFMFGSNPARTGAGTFTLGTLTATLRNDLAPGEYSFPFLQLTEIRAPVRSRVLGNNSYATTLQTTTITVTAGGTPLPAIRINSGGPQYTSPSTGNVFSADTGFTGGSTTTYSNRNILNTEDDSLYLRQRFGTNFGYSISVPNGSYNLLVHMAECAYNSANQRRFNITVNGTVARANYDIFVRAGGNNRAIVETIPVNVSNGVVTVNFQSTLSGRNAIVAALELVPNSPPSPAPPAAPSNLTATAVSSSQIHLAWTDNASNEEGFRIERRTGAQSFVEIAAVGPDTTSFSDTGLAPATTYTYRVRAYNSAGSSDYSNEASATTQSEAASPTRINSGGSQYTSPTTGHVFLADRNFSGGSTTTRSNRDILNTTDDPLYLSLRFGTSFSYNIPTANGSYTLRLHFAETGVSASNQRLFHVDVNGSRVLSNFDLFVAAGGANRALVQSFPVNVTNGNLTILFTSVKSNAFINAIELIPDP